MNKKMIYILLIAILVIPATVLAYRPGRVYSCGHYQSELLEIIKKYYKYEEESKSIYLGKDFDDLYNKLLEKKYVDKPIYYRTSDCSYGITLKSDSIEIYCKYHGNKKNTNEYENMCSRQYFVRKYSNDGFLEFICCIVLSVALSFIKSLVKKSSKKSN